MKIKILVPLLILALMLGAGFAVNAEDKAAFEPPEDGLEINYIKGHSDRDLSVEFNHSSHESYSCQDCHHKMFQLKEGEDPRSCSTCHDNFDVDNTKGYKSYFKAMHKIRQAPKKPRASCVACHTTEFGDDKSMTGCTRSGCHSDGLN